MVTRGRENFKIGLYAFVVVILGVYGPLLGWQLIRQVYRDHHDNAARWTEIVNEKNHLKYLLSNRDEYISSLESELKKKHTKRPSARSVSALPGSASSDTVLALTDMQEIVLRRDLTGCAVCYVRINAIGSSEDTRDLADELRRLFKGWRISGGNIGNTNAEAPPGIEFEIPHPENPSVQIAIRAFDHAHIRYSKNVSPSGYRGPLDLGEPPPLTINVSNIQ
jgi:hypothetical protein